MEDVSINYEAQYKAMVLTCALITKRCNRAEKRTKEIESLSISDWKVKSTENGRPQIEITLTITSSLMNTKVIEYRFDAIDWYVTCKEGNFIEYYDGDYDGLHFHLCRDYASVTHYGGNEADIHERFVLTRNRADDLMEYLNECSSKTKER